MRGAGALQSSVLIVRSHPPWNSTLPENPPCLFPNLSVTLEPFIVIMQLNNVLLKLMKYKCERNGVVVSVKTKLICLERLDKSMSN